MRIKWFVMSAAMGVMLCTSCADAKNKDRREQNPKETSAETFAKPDAERRPRVSSRGAGMVDFTEAAEKSVNSVVHVMTKYVTAGQSYQRNDILGYFFGQPRQRTQPQEHGGSGSGVILSEDGYIVTNNHVIEGATKISVVLNDKRTFEATLVGADPSTDLALLKIEAESLPVMPIGNSDELRIGEWVLAVGNPFNLTSTVTAGIVSAKARNINILSGDMKIESFIQTDAAVNPGNSGGALVNLSGELVGINSAIASQTGSFAGYAFAIPVSIMSKVVGDLRKYGVVQRALLGVMIQDITADFAEQKGIRQLDGVYVANVSKGGSADDAGIREGDVVTKVDGQTVKSVAEMQERISRFSPGDEARITVLRANQEHDFVVTLKNTKGGTTAITKADNISLGVELKQLTAQERSSLGIDYGIRIVGRTREKGVLSALPEGLIILKANNAKVRDAEDMAEIVESVKSLTGQYAEKVVFISGILRGRMVYYSVEMN